VAARLTARAVAERAGRAEALVRRLVELGILTPDAERRFDPTDVHLVRLMGAFEESGISLDDVASGFASGDLTYSGMGAYFTEPEPYAGTFGERAERVGRPFDLVARLVAAFGLPQPHPADRVRADEAAIVERFLSAGRSSTRRRVPTAARRSNGSATGSCSTSPTRPARSLPRAPSSTGRRPRSASPRASA